MKSFSVKEHVLKSGAAPFEIPALLSIYVFYGIYILIHDWICYFGKLDTSIVTYAVALAVFAVLAVIFAVRNRKSRSIKFTEPEFSRWDFLVFAVFLFLFFIRVGRPDVSYDTVNYHLNNQMSPFADSITDNFFIGDRETFFPAFADRMFNPFRLLLGYRMGTIASVFILIISYYQVKRLLCKCCPVLAQQVCLLSLFSAAAFCTHLICMEFSSYCVDWFPFPLILYVLECVVDVCETDQCGDFFLALCAGMTVALKLSYGFLLVPLGLLFLWENRKRLSPILLLLFAVFGVLPVSIYMLNAWKQTGNPVYPMFNTLFHSPLLTNENFILNVDARVTGFWDGLIRPISQLWIEIPQHLGRSDGRLTLGFICALALLLIPGKLLKQARQAKVLSGCQIAMTYFWVFFIDAYPRLALILEVSGGILIICLIMQCWYAVEKPHFFYPSAVLISILLLVSMGYTGVTILFGNSESCWAYSMISPNGYSARNGLCLLGKDRSLSEKDCNTLSQVKVWMRFESVGSEMRLLNPHAPVISFSPRCLYTDASIAQRDALMEKHGTDGLFTIAECETISSTLEAMSDNGYVLSGAPQRMTPYFSDRAVYLIPLESGSISNKYGSLSDSTPVYTQTLAGDDTIHILTGYVGLSSLIDTWNVDFQPITLRFTLRSGETSTVLTETTIEPDFEYHSFALPCNAQANTGDILTVEAFNPDGNPYGYFIDLINIRVS